MVDHKLKVGDVVEASGLFTPMIETPMALIVSAIGEDGVVHLNATYLGVFLGKVEMDYSLLDRKRIWRWV